MGKERFFIEGQETLTLHVRLEEKSSEKIRKVDFVGTNELMCQIYPWIEESKQDMDNFGVILELVGVETPIKIYDISTEDGVQILKATTAARKNITILTIPSTAEFIVEEEQEIRLYKTSYVDGEVKVTLTRRQVRGSGKKINCVYKRNECSMTLEIYDMLIFTIRIDKPNNMCDSPKVLKRSEEIIRHLLTLKEDAIISEPDELMFEVRKRFFVNEVYGTTAVHRFSSKTMFVRQGFPSYKK